MKNYNIVLIFLLSLIFSDVHAQRFNYTWIDDNNISTAVTVFTGFRMNGDTVQSVIKREKGTHPAGINISSSTVHFVGNEFWPIDNYIEFDLSDYKYYFVPANLDLPIVEITNSDINNKVQIFIDSDFDNFDTTSSLSNGQWWYFCSCHMSLQSPGGCVSTLNLGVTTCISDTGCDGACQGWMIYVNSVRKGGGVFVKVEDSISIVDDF